MSIYKIKIMFHDSFLVTLSSTVYNIVQSRITARIFHKKVLKPHCISPVIQPCLNTFWILAYCPQIQVICCYWRHQTSWRQNPPKGKSKLVLAIKYMSYRVTILATPWTAIMLLITEVVWAIFPIILMTPSTTVMPAIAVASGGSSRWGSM